MQETPKTPAGRRRLIAVVRAELARRDQPEANEKDGESPPNREGQNKRLPPTLGPPKKPDSP